MLLGAVSHTRHDYVKNRINEQTKRNTLIEQTDGFHLMGEKGKGIRKFNW